MKLKKSVSNPMLVGSMELLKADDTKEHFTMFLTELQKAELLAPALINPAPVEEEEGERKILPGSMVQFPMLSASDGNRYFMGFTDEGEYRLWEEKNQPCPTFALKFDDYIGLMMRKNADGQMSNAQGIIVNPYGANLVLHKDLLANIMAGRMIHFARKRDDGK